MKMNRTVSTEQVNSHAMTAQYIALLGFFWIGAATLFSFSSVYLQNKGFNGTQTGVVLGLANLLGFFLQPVVGNIADRSAKLTPPKLLAYLLLIVIVLLVFLYDLPEAFFLISVTFLVASAINSCIIPLTHSVSIYYENNGVSVNFGLARGLGSLFYALSTSVTGTVIERFTADVLPIEAAGFYLIAAEVSFLMPAIVHSRKSQNNTISEKQASPFIALVQIMKTNKRFSLVLLGVFFFSIFHTSHTNLTIYIVEKIGGNASNVGIFLSISAFAEIPVMILFSKLAHRFSVTSLLKFSGIFFFIKSIAVALASNMTLFYLAGLLQFGSYGVFLPASVYYVNEKMSDSEKFTGQSAMTAICTLATVVATCLGGIIFDSLGVPALNLFGVVTAAIGALLVFLFA